MTKLEQLREMLKEANCPHFDAYEGEGQDAAGRYHHSLCGHDGDPLDAGSGAGAGPGGGWGRAPAGVQRSWRRGVGGGVSPRASVVCVMERRQS